MRGLTNVTFIYLDEADFFPPGQQSDARDVSERYIAKSNPWIVMVSTPNAPGGLFEQIEKEPDESCLYRRLFLDYTYGIGRIYTEEEIQKAKTSPSFEREYDLKYLGLIGNVFSQQDIDLAIEKGRAISPDVVNNNCYTMKTMGVDPAYGSSSFAICITELIDGEINVLFADEYPKADFNQMIILTLNLIKKFRMNFNSGDGIYIDGANPSFKRALKSQLREDSNYEQLIAFFTRNNPPNRADTEFLTNNMFVIPIAFKNHHKEMLAHCKQLMEYRNGYMAINPKFDKLIVALRTAVEKGEGLLDKEMTSHNDCFDAFRLSLIRWKL